MLNDNRKYGWTHQEAGFWFDALAWSPDGTRLALAGSSQSSSPPRPSFVQIWQVQGWQHVAESPISTNDAQGQLACGQLAWSPDGRYLAACQSNNNPASIRFWHAASGKLAFSYEAVSFPDRLTWSPNGRFLAVVDNRQPGSFFSVQPG